MSNLKLSATAIDNYYSGCTMRLDFYRSYETTKKSRALHLGELFHLYMEKGIPKDADEEAKELAERMYKFIDKEGYEILYKEWRHLAPMVQGVDVHGIVDALALKDGETVLVDYKSAGSPWQLLKRVNGKRHVAPQAETFQGVIYTTPPYTPPDGFKKWPDTIHYIVVPKDGGPIRTHPFTPTAEDRDNLAIACEEISKSITCKHKGWACNRCKYKEICWNIPGWENKFKEKK